MSSIEHKLLSRRFQYLQPYFYTNPYALRCELGSGEGDEYLLLARRRAREIHDILMPGGADAIIFNYWITDYSCTGAAEAEEIDDIASVNASYIETEAKRLRFLLHSMAKYRHAAVKRLKAYDNGDQSRVRMICYSDGKGFDDAALMDMEIENDGVHEIGLVSFANECILSVYDDRGCDITFASRTKMRRFYERLKPYFLAYDAEEMERRFTGNKKE